MKRVNVLSAEEVVDDVSVVLLFTSTTLDPIGIAWEVRCARCHAVEDHGAAPDIGDVYDAARSHRCDPAVLARVPLDERNDR